MISNFTGIVREFPVVPVKISAFLSVFVFGAETASFVLKSQALLQRWCPVPFDLKALQTDGECWRCVNRLEENNVENRRLDMVR